MRANYSNAKKPVTKHKEKGQRKRKKQQFNTAQTPSRSPHRKLRPTVAMRNASMATALLPKAMEPPGLSPTESSPLSKPRGTKQKLLETRMEAVGAARPPLPEPIMAPQPRRGGRHFVSPRTRLPTRPSRALPPSAPSPPPPAPNPRQRPPLTAMTERPGRRPSATISQGSTSPRLRGHSDRARPRPPSLRVPGCGAGGSAGERGALWAGLCVRVRGGLAVAATRWACAGSRQIETQERLRGRGQGSRGSPRARECHRWGDWGNPVGTGVSPVRGSGGPESTGVSLWGDRGILRVRECHRWAFSLAEIHTAHLVLNTLFILVKFLAQPYFLAQCPHTVIKLTACL